jgi:cation diffusion facilitator CzcD-associated flavoprotein CzcO
MNMHVQAATGTAAAQGTYHQIVIIGCGFGGIATAIALKNDGIRDFKILERAADVGGTWRDNSYPGAACDVVSRLYSFSFEQDYPWSSPFAPQPEILDYIKKCVAKHDLLSHVQFNTEVTGASFDEPAGLWHIRTQTGESFVTPILISAVGLFKEPNIPNIPGREDFGGVQFHSARWRHDFDLTGKTVAVIGNGASAVQFVPQIAQKVAKLQLFQRTPQYVMPKAAFPGTSSWDTWLGQKRWLRPIARFKVFLMFERFLLRRVLFPKARLKAEAAYRNILASKVKDPALRKKLTPDYPIGCKRLLVSDLWLDALVRPNVAVIDTPITRITRDGVETADGSPHKVDAIIFGTGFRTTDHLAPMQITGLAGKDLNHEWRMGAEAYLGITVSGFPNFFMLYGPNTNAASSIIFMLEIQARYIVRCIRKLQNNRARYMNVRADPQRRFNEEAQARLSRTVPAMAGCHTYFKNEFGRLTTNWPGYASEYRWRTRDVRTSDYDFVGDNVV